MSKAREARRRQERAMKATGVALVCREALPLQDAPIGRGPSIDILVAYVGETLRTLAGAGADLTGTIAITIGQDHPNFLAGQTVIEAKAARAKPVTPPADDCPGCPVDHSDLEMPEIVRHFKCRTPACIDPNHLRKGSSADNSADMVRDGMSRRGEKSSTAKLTRGDVREIRHLRSEGWTQHQLCEKFGVKQSTVSDILRRRSWAWLDDPA